MPHSFLPASSLLAELDLHSPADSGPFSTNTVWAETELEDLIGWENRSTKRKEHTMSETHNSVIAVIGIDIGKNSFHVVGLDGRGAIALRQKWSRGQVETRLATMPACLIGMEACIGAHHPSRRLRLLGDQARLMPASSSTNDAL